MAIYAGAQVERFGLPLTVFDLVEEYVAIERARVRLFGVGAGHPLADRSAQWVVFGGEIVAAAVPCADRLASYIVQHETCAGFHAELGDAVAEEVMRIAPGGC